jgi:beta-lactamase class A
MSLRDIALFMISMSDNAATDVLYSRIGAPAVNQVIEDLGLTNTHMRSDMGPLA